MGAEVDPYEQQLLAVFDSCDEENQGSLDRQGLLLLCDQLQLEEQGAQLVEHLLGGITQRVTFVQFRDGLLALLDQGNTEKNHEGNDNELPVREVSPKFVFGKKKYGRRTRPKSADLNSADHQDDSDSDGMSNSNNPSKCDQDIRSPTSDNATVPKKRKKSPGVGLNQERLPLGMAELSGAQGKNALAVTGSADSPTKLANTEGEECLKSACEILGVGNDGYINRAELALVCDHIGMEKIAEEVVTQVFDSLDEAGENRISLKEFLRMFLDRGSGSWSVAHSTPERENPRLKRRSGSGDRPTAPCPSDDATDFWLHDLGAHGVVSSELILEVWEMTGVQDGASLLLNLGFTEPRIKLAELLEILGNELQSLRANIDESVPLTPTETIYQATLALSQTEVRGITSSFEQVSRERDKLRVDIIEANERASLLAQEVDDHHSRLENANKAQIKALEQRYAESVKELTERLTAERDQLAHQCQTLESRVWELEELDLQTRSELAAFKAETQALNLDNQNLLEQLTNVEVKYIAAQKELDAYDNFRQGLNEIEVLTDNAKIKALLEKLEDVQGENTDLRDRNDELTMKVEALASKLAQAVITVKKPGSICDVSNDARLINQQYSEPSCASVDDLVMPGGAIKRRGDPPDSFSALEESSDEESPRLEKVRRCCSTPEAVDMPLMQVRTLTPSGKVVNLIFSEDFLLNDSLSNDNTLDSSSASKSGSSNLDDSLPVQGDCFNQQLEMLTEKLSVNDEDPKANREDQDVLPSHQPEDVTSQRDEHISNAKETTAEEENTKEQLEQHCRDLKSQLDQVKIEIVKILAERNASCKENCALKDHISNMETSLVTSLPVEECNTGDVPPLECNSNSLELNATASTISEQEKSHEEIILALKRDFADKLSILEANHTQEKIELLEHSTNLESSMEMLREEYERCEDYWSSKLEEERVFFDKENRTLEKKYKTILSKFDENSEDDNGNRAGNEDLFNENPSSSEDLYNENLSAHDDSFHSNRLSTIDEYAMLESQVTAVELECEDLKKQIQSERAEHEIKIKQLEEQIEQERSKCAALNKEQDMNMLTNEAIAMNWESSDNEQEEVSMSEARAIPYNPACPNVDRHTNASQQVRENVYEAVCNVDDKNLRNASKNLRAELLADVKLLEEKAESLKQAQKDAKEGNGTKDTCYGDKHFLQNMNTRCRQQEQRCREIQATMRQRQQHTDTLLGQNWALHKQEVEEMDAVLIQTQEHLHQQSLEHKDMLDRMARNDLLVKDLYVENAYLVATVQRLEQRCQTLAQMTTDSSSV